MPIYEYLCKDCGKISEILVFSSFEPECPDCGSLNLKKLMSPSSSLSGKYNKGHLPGPRDTGCCGNKVGQVAGCSGPGSCCGKA